MSVKAVVTGATPLCISTAPFGSALNWTLWNSMYLQIQNAM